jgi:hypothetical protein
MKVVTKSNKSLSTIPSVIAMISRPFFGPSVASNHALQSDVVSVSPSNEQLRLKLTDSLSILALSYNGR